jgi:hypothetical protein
MPIPTQRTTNAAVRQTLSQCPICGHMFERTHSGTNRKEHLRTVHPDYTRWKNRSGRIGTSLGLLLLIWLGFGGVSLWLNGGDSFPGFWLPGFLALFAVLLLGYIPYAQLQTRHFRHAWNGHRPRPAVLDIPVRREERSRSQLDIFAVRRKEQSNTNSNP